MDKDALDDPLARLAAELERLSAASLQLGDATADLARAAGAEDAEALRGAAAASRRAARAAASASARVNP